MHHWGNHHHHHHPGRRSWGHEAQLGENTVQPLWKQWIPHWGIVRKRSRNKTANTITPFYQSMLLPHIGCCCILSRTIDQSRAVLSALTGSSTPAFRKDSFPNPNWRCRNQTYKERALPLSHSSAKVTTFGVLFIVSIATSQKRYFRGGRRAGATLLWGKTIMAEPL